MEKKSLLRAVSCLIIIMTGLNSCKKNTLQDSQKAGKPEVFPLPVSSASSGLIPTPKDILNKVPFLNQHSQTVKDENNGNMSLSVVGFRSEMPAVFALNSPAIANQQWSSSCTGWSGAYCAWSIEYSNHNLIGNNVTTYNNDNTFNPEYIYTEFVNNCQKGTSLYALLSYLVREGALPISTLPVKPGLCENLPYQPDNIEKAEEAKYKIPNLRLYQAPKDEMSMKQFLRAGHPIIIAFHVDDSMCSLQTAKTFVWSVYSFPIVSYSPSFLDMKNFGKEFSVSRQAMTIIGYDDYKRAYKVQNSWGNQYADHGYLWISYDFFEKGKITQVPVLDINSSTSSGFGITYIPASTPEDVFDEAYVFY